MIIRNANWYYAYNWVLNILVLTTRKVVIMGFGIVELGILGVLCLVVLAVVALVVVMYFRRQRPG